MIRDLYYVYRVGSDRVLMHIYAKTICTPLEIRKYVEFLTASDHFGYSYVALKVNGYIPDGDGVKVVL